MAAHENGVVGIGERLDEETLIRTLLQIQARDESMLG